MQMIKNGKQCGCNQYMIRDSQDKFWGWLFKEYSPWITVFGKEPAYEWTLELHSDCPIWHDDLHWQYLKEAKQWLNENIS